ncbi:MAG: hypothetical protein O7H40_00870 [Gammaproteobacteria bacterium]|nr:hypothetical protein [Gammaproteobacteria bacterium]
MATLVFCDQYGDIIDRAEDGFIEIRWFDSTDAMSGEEFQSWLERFVLELERLERQRVLVDTTQFRMNPAQMNTDWRDQSIIPRYNAAGVERFAFHMPAGMPAIGAEPGPEGPAVFPTAYFGTRADALSWLRG